MSAILTLDQAGPWAVCPRCRVFVDKLSPETMEAHGANASEVDVKCPWCSMLATLAQWIEAGARDVCAYGCPRASHAAYKTSDGRASGGEKQKMRIESAPCVVHGCSAISGAREIRLV